MESDNQLTQYLHPLTIDETGNKYGSYVVLQQGPSIRRYNKKGKLVASNATFYCRCLECDTIHLLKGIALRAQKPKSCFPCHIKKDTLTNRPRIRKSIQKKQLENKGTLGFFWRKKEQSFEARIQINKIIYFLGCFKTPLEAAKAYDKAAFETYGFDAVLNFPEDYK